MSVAVLDAAPSIDTYQSGDKVTVKLVLAGKDAVLWLPPGGDPFGGRAHICHCQQRQWTEARGHRDRFADA
ncbi:MAG: hypothetical protein M0C28_19395 [Candidatus Moduliflexus flocculans]|nr:hypothetical protein [Candidatus Moduliflexus flocculans]